MAIVYPIREQATRDGSLDGKAVREFRRRWMVRSTVVNEHPDAVRLATGIPRVWDYHPTDDGASVRKVTAKQSETREVWFVDVEYSSEPITSADDPNKFVENPLERPATLEWSGAQFTRPATLGIPFSDPPKQTSQPVVGTGNPADTIVIPLSDTFGIAVGDQVQLTDARTGRVVTVTVTAVSPGVSITVTGIAGSGSIYNPFVDLIGAKALKPIANTAGDPFLAGSGTDIDDSRPVLKITRNWPFWDEGLGILYQDAINSLPWLIASARQAKMQVLNANRKYEGKYQFWEVAAEIHFRRELWVLSLLNAGFRYLKADGDWDLIRDENGTPVTDPWPLDKSGKPFKRPTKPGTGETPFYVKYRVYKELDFNLLPLLA